MHLPPACSMASSSSAPPDVLDVVVVGAGLSGLVAATALAPRYPRIRVMEARARVGGRLLSTADGVDLGAMWWWGHDPAARRLADTLGVGSVPMRLDGKAWVQRPGRPAEQVGPVGDQLAPCGPDAHRFAGGYAELAARLAAALPAGALQLRSRVLALEHTPHGDGGPSYIRVSAEAGGSEAVPGTLFARRVVLALPPRLIGRIAFSPPLPAPQQRMLAETATWCGDWSKVVATFRRPFWRDRGDSGVVATPSGLVETWFEAGGGAAHGEAVAALAGLGFGASAAARLDAHGPAAAATGAAAGASGLGESPPQLRAAVVAALGQVFGARLVAEQLLSVSHKCWMADRDTYAPPPEGGEPGGDPRRRYGDEWLRTPTPWGVHFAGTESEAEAGHVAGALRAGKRAAREVAAAMPGGAPS